MGTSWIGQGMASKIAENQPLMDQVRNNPATPSCW